MTLDDLRRLAVAQTLFAPTTVDRAVEDLRFARELAAGLDRVRSFLGLRAGGRP
jgi:hypothetical protein